MILRDPVSSERSADEKLRGALVEAVEGTMKSMGLGKHGFSSLVNLKSTRDGVAGASGVCLLDGGKCIGSEVGLG